MIEPTQRRRRPAPAGPVRLLLPLAVFFMLLTAGPTLYTREGSLAADECGVERWSVKTGTDADATLVNLGWATPTSIVAMRAWARPASLPSAARVAPYERTLYTLGATLTRYKSEDDSDYHLVLSDAAGNTIVAEIAWPGCVFSGPFAAGIANARTRFDARLTATTSFKTANIPVKVTGVGFFDFFHGQTGAAPNVIELHPLLDITFNPAPRLVTEPGTDRALALDSVTLTRDPLPFVTSYNFSADRRTRVMLFAQDVVLMPGESAASVTAQAEDAQQRTYALPVESVRDVPGQEWLTQINVRLPDELQAGGDLRVSISLRGQASNKALVKIVP